MSELKDRITYLRLGLGLTQEQFRDALNAELRASGQQPVSRGAVSNWESGSKGAAMRNLIALSGLTGASIDWLAATVAALRLGRRAFSAEMNPDFYQGAVDRVRQALPVRLLKAAS